jgi:hypothetical protein
MVLPTFVELGASVGLAFTGTRVQHPKLLTCASVLAMSDNELVAEITKLIEDNPFHGEGYRSINVIRCLTTLADCRTIR